MYERFPRKFDVQTSYKPSNYVLGLIFVVNIKFPGATYRTIMPSTEEFYCLTREIVFDFRAKLALYNKNNRVLLSRKLDVQFSNKSTNYVLGLIFLVNTRCSRATCQLSQRKLSVVPYFF